MTDLAPAPVLPGDDAGRLTVDDVAAGMRVSWGDPPRTGVVASVNEAERVVEVIPEVPEEGDPLPAVTVDVGDLTVLDEAPGDAPVTAAAIEDGRAPKGMIALRPSADDAARLALPGGDPADLLHLTLCYLGDVTGVDDDTRGLLRQSLQAFAESLAVRPDMGEPLALDTWAAAAINPADPDAACTAYLVGGPSGYRLGTFREDATMLARLLLGDRMPEQHEPFVPHVTVQQGSTDVAGLDQFGPVTFDAVRLAFGDDDVTDFDIAPPPIEQLPGETITSDDVTEEEAMPAPEPEPADDLDEIIAAATPVAPPDEWFADPGLSRPTPLTVDDTGRVYGHLAAFGTCHIGFGGQCITPPRERSYDYFRTGEVVTASGSRVPVGHLTLGGGHAGKSLDAAGAARHYDETGSAVADVAAGSDRHGIWVAGAVRPGVDPERIHALRASAPSGDWRRIGGQLRLVAALCVNVPGFPIPRQATSVVADGQPQALVAAAILAPEGADGRPRFPSAADALAASIGRTRHDRARALVASVHPETPEET